jgi:hypothetical protein
MLSVYLDQGTLCSVVVYNGPRKLKIVCCLCSFSNLDHVFFMFTNKLINLKGYNCLCPNIFIL